MKKLILLIGSILTVIICHAQKIQTYSGPYVTEYGNKGHITYHYYDTEEYDRIYQGPIDYSCDRIFSKSFGKCKITAHGRFNRNLKEGPWKYQIIHKKENDIAIETLKGNYKDGMMEGTWSDITRVKDKTVMKSIIHLKHNKPFGSFYLFDQGNSYYTRSQYYNKLEIKGQFNNQGLYDGEWRATYQRMNIHMEMIQRYKYGVLYWEIHRNKANGEILSRINEKEFTEQFFNNLDSATQISIVDNVKYVLLKKSLPNKRHPIYYGFSFWTQKPYNNYGRFKIYGSIPSYMIEKGDLMQNAQHYPLSTIVKWEDTYEGKKELKYRKTIESANNLFKENYYYQASEAYSRALKIKYSEDIKLKIQECKIEQQKVEQKRIDDKYNKQMEYASFYFNDKNYRVAANEYSKALKIKETDEVKAKIQECISLKQKAEQKKIDDEFNLHIKQAEYLFSKGKYVVASYHYQKANHLKEDPVLSQKIIECEQRRQSNLYGEEVNHQERERINEINDKIAIINDKHEKLYNLYHPISIIASEAAGTNIRTTKKKKLWDAYNLLYNELAEEKDEDKRGSLKTLNTMIEIQIKMNDIRHKRTRALEKALKNETNTDIIIQKIKES